MPRGDVLAGPRPPAHRAGRQQDRNEMPDRLRHLRILIPCQRETCRLRSLRATVRTVRSTPTGCYPLGTPNLIGSRPMKPAAAIAFVRLSPTGSDDGAVGTVNLRPAPTMRRGRPATRRSRSTSHDPTRARTRSWRRHEGRTARHGLRPQTKDGGTRRERGLLSSRSADNFI